MSNARELSQLPNGIDVTPAGNVGIGTASAAVSLDVQKSGDVQIRARETGLGVDTRVVSVGGVGQAGIIGTYSNHPLVTYTNGVERVRVDTSGNVGIGTSSPQARLQVNSEARVVNGSNVCQLLVDGSATYFGPTGAAELRFQNNLNTRAMFDTSGNLLVGKTATDDSTTGFAYRVAGYISVARNGGAPCYFNRTGTDGAVVEIANDNSTVGSISVSGSSTAYNTSSDYRLKENITPMTSALAKVSQLKPVTYKWKVDGSDGEGFIAHELQEVLPQCVTGEKDAVDAEGKPVYQGIDTSFLVATLTAAIQEQQTLITQLQADIAELKTKVA